MKLRKKNLYAKTVNIWIKYSNFYKVSKQIKVSNSIDTDDDIYHYALLLFNEIWDNNYYIRGLCVGVDNLSNKHDKQLSLFNTEDDNYMDEDKENLQKAMDIIKERYGNDKIGYADEMKNND